MAELKNNRVQLVYKFGKNQYERVNPMTLANIVQMDEEENPTARNIINYIAEQLLPKADKATSLSGYGIEDAYTKTQIDEKFAKLVNFHARVVESLPPIGEYNVLYLVLKTGGSDYTSDVYDEYIWVVEAGATSGKYEFLGTTAVDLSDYYKKTETDELLETKQDSLDLTETGLEAVKTITTQNGRVGQEFDGEWKAFVLDGEVALPEQEGNEGKYLKTDGTQASWEEVDALPKQEGFAGGQLVTNGESASWEKMSFSAEIVLEANAWDENRLQSLIIRGVGLDDIVVVTPTVTITGDNESLYAACGVKALEQEPNKITFYCKKLPTEDISVSLGVVKIKNYVNVSITADQDDASINTWITETNL